MSPWAIIWTYWGLLGVIAATITFKGSAPMRRTIWTIAIVCALQFVIGTWVLQTDSVAHAVVMFCIDALACWNIVRQPAALWQSLVGSSFVIQLGMHIGRLAANNPDMNFYWNGLSVMAFCQLFLVGGWWLDERGLFRRRRPRHSPAFEAHRKGMDG